MRASELLGRPVTGPRGPLGMVIDVRLVQQGKLKGSSNALQVEGLVVGHHRVASRLGYDRYPKPGPALVRLVVRRLGGANGYLLWEDVSLTETGVVSAADLRELPAL